MSQFVTIKLHEKADTVAAFPVQPGQEVLPIDIDKIAVLEGGMKSGKPSLALCIDLPLGAKPGSALFGEISFNNFVILVGIVRGACKKWGVEFPA